MCYMGKEINKVNKSFDLILQENRAFIDEVAASSTSLFGGDDVKIPRAGAHAGQSGWQSSNAWDVKAAVGTPVYAIADGVAQTFSDYGRSIIKTNGKKLYGQSFTVKSDGNLPDVYYTHLEGSPVRKGAKIQCGQFLGYVMDMPGSSYDHVHIGISRGDISQFLTSDGKLRCGGGGITGDVGEFKPSKSSDDDGVDGTSSDKELGTTKPIPTEFDSDFGEIIGMKKKSLKESFGKDTKEKYGTVTIPAKSNSTILSPVNGKIETSKYSRSCKNEITIKMNGNKGYLQYCGITDPKVEVGDKVSRGTVLGKTKDDVEVVFFDKGFRRSDLKGEKLDYDSEKENQKLLDKRAGKREKEYYDPAMALIPSAIASVFKDKIDKKGNVEKRMGYATDKKPVDPWIVNSISKPFEKIGKFLGTNKSKEEKVNENVERIKKLL